MTDQKLVDELEKALRDEAYDGGFGYMGDEQFTAYVRTLAETAAEVFEKALTPTDDEREALREQIAYRVQTAVAYGKGVQKWGQLSERTQDAWIDEQVALAMNSRAVSGFRRSGAASDDERIVRALDYIENGTMPPDRRDWLRALAAGFRRSEVPEPSAGEDEFTPGECDGSGKCPAEMHVHGCYMPHRADQCDSPDEYGHLPAEPQGEPSDAQEAIRVASPDTWDWDACVVCGSKDVTDRGMMVLFSAKDGVYVSRVAWCDQSQECRDDLRQAGASMLTDQDAKSIDAALRAAGGLR
ncbi:hypothetical protein [Microbacterium maritypicum]